MKNNVISYSPFRAFLALAVPIVVLFIPMLNFVYDATDFEARYISKPYSTAGLFVGIIWWIWALWPSAISFLKAGFNEIYVEDSKLVFAGREEIDLIEIEDVVIIDRFLRPKQIEICRKGSLDPLFFTIAYQNLFLRKNASQIKILLDRVRRGRMDGS